MRTLVLQHIACEPPGYYEDVLLDRGGVIHRVEVDEGDPLPDWREFELIVAMGGPMSVNDEDEFPWLVPEKRLICEAVHAGTPFWGACLGVQLLASSLGARVHSSLVVQTCSGSDSREQRIVPSGPLEMHSIGAIEPSSASTTSAIVISAAGRARR